MPLTAREKLIEADVPLLEADLGGGRELSLSERMLGWRVGEGSPAFFRLAEVGRVRLARRPVWEALFVGLGVAAVSAGALRGWTRGAGLVFAALWVAAGITQRLASFAVEMKDGRRAALRVGVGPAANLRAQSVWESFRIELSRLGVAVACALLFLGGCGYRFTAGGAPLPEGIRIVEVPLFANKTAEPGLEAALTDAMRLQISRAGLECRSGAAARLDGEVLSVSGGPGMVTVNSTGVGTSTLVSYHLFASVRLRLQKDGRTVADAVIQGAEDYLPGVDITQSEANRGAALGRLAQAMAKDGYERLATGW